MRKNILYVSLVVVLLVSFAASCAPKATEAPAPAATEAPAPTEAMAAPTEAPATTGWVCDYDQQTCDYLEGKDFTGQTLVVGVWGGTIEEIVRKWVIPPLEAHGGKVELLLGGTSDRLTKVYAERENPTMGIAFLNIYESRQAMADGVTEEPGPKIPAYNDLYPLAQIGGYGQSFAGLGIAYNPAAFPGGPPKWIDLWDPSHKGKIALPAYPGSEGDAMLSMAARVHGKDETDPDFAFQQMELLKPFVMTWQNLDDIFPLLESGEVHATPMISGYAYTYIDKGMNIGFSWPEDGIPIIMDTLCIVTNNPTPEMADAYAQVSLGVTVQTHYAEDIYFGTTNTKVVLTGLPAERTVYGDKADRLVGLQWEFIIKERVPNTEKWNRLLLEE
jgi:putative spermidine/putrescine transport system substrate-binding protein